MTAMTYDGIRERIARKRGYLKEGVELTDLDDETLRFVEQFIEDGQNSVYEAHDWTFLKPVVSLTIADGESEIVLPANFRRIEGDIYFDGSHNAAMPILLGNKQQILKRRQPDDTRTGIPKIAAIEERAPSNNQGSRKFLMFYPEADDDYRIWLQYAITPETLSPRQQYPYGGRGVGMTIMHASMAASENFDGEMGIHTQLFKESLASSIENDRRAQPQILTAKGMALTRSRTIATFDNTEV